MPISRAAEFLRRGPATGRVKKRRNGETGTRTGGCVVGEAEEASIIYAMTALSGA